MSQSLRQRTDVALPNGLASAVLEELTALIAEITGHALQERPFLAPTLLFAEPAVQAALPLPRAAPGMALIHDYQAQDNLAPLPLDTPLAAVCGFSDRGALREFEVKIGANLRIRSAMRTVPSADLIAAQPLHLKESALSGAQFGPLSVSAEQIQRYLALSGDTNPLHSDPAVAQGLGLADVVVPGLLAAALMQPFIAASHPMAPLTRLRLRFTAPLLAGQAFSFALQPRNAQTLRVFLRRAEGAAAVFDLSSAA